MGCYWEISGDVIAKKGSVEEVADVLTDYGIDFDEEEDEKISFASYDYASYSTPDDLDKDLRPLVKGGEFTAKCDEDNSTSCYRYGREPYYEKTNVLEYYPSQIEEFVKTLPKDFVDAVIRTYVRPEAKKEDKNVRWAISHASMRGVCTGIKVKGENSL